MRNKPRMGHPQPVPGPMLLGLVHARVQSRSGWDTTPQQRPFVATGQVLLVQGIVESRRP